ncbi:sensor histidine kinase [Tellurirhabdus rosea]|uniref:sensor histidine kinase n=1 Tax=Tellurirhabdus rosea TaxID=2674997 RepID=UPI00224F27A3|nr:ATP-binding protein [Tellurirhabdus rosea]
MLFLIIFIITFALLFQRRQTQYRLEKQALTEAYEREILNSQIEIQNQTLNHLGEELHDHIGQMMSLTLLLLNRLDEDLAGMPQQPMLKRALEVAETTMQDIRNLSKTLDSSTIHRFGLEESLRLELERIQRAGRYETRLDVAGTPYGLGPETETVLFRMAQESLNNAIKHALGQQLTIGLNYLPDTFSLTIADNGRGFSIDEALNRTIDRAGSGLHNLNRRARLLGGNCTLTSIPDQGTRVTIQIPRSSPASLPLTKNT